MFDVVGYAEIKLNATTCKGAKNPEQFKGKICRVFEFAADGGVLVLNPEGTALGMFDKEDVFRSFKCSEFGDIICAPNLTFIEQASYHHKCLARKGGYNNTVKMLVIGASLAKGEFHDSLLWQKQ